MKGQSSWSAWTFALPTLAIFGCLVIYPAAEGLLLSVMDVSVAEFASGQSTAVGRYVGWLNYSALFANRDFMQSLQVMLGFTVVTTVLELGFGLLVALAFEYLFRPPRLIRTLLLVPMFVIPLVSGLTFRYVFDPLDGAAAEIMRAFNREAPDLLGTPAGAFFLIVWQDFWRMWPFVFLILMAGLKTIPRDLLEAYAIDGGSGFKAIFHVVLPLLGPSLLMAGGLKVIESLKAFTEIYTMTGGGPGQSTTTLSLFIVREGFEAFHVSSAAAAGTLLLGAGLVLGVTYSAWQLVRIRQQGGRS